MNDPVHIVRITEDQPTRLIKVDGAQTAKIVKITENRVVTVEKKGQDKPLQVVRAKEVERIVVRTNSIVSGTSSTHEAFNAELNDNQIDYLDLYSQGEGKKYELTFVLTKQVSGVYATGKVVVLDNGEMAHYSFEHGTDEFICDVDIQSELNSGKIRLKFILNAVGENLIFDAKGLII